MSPGLAPPCHPPQGGSAAGIGPQVVAFDHIVFTFLNLDPSVPKAVDYHATHGTVPCEDDQPIPVNTTSIEFDDRSAREAGLGRAVDDYGIANRRQS